MFDDYDHITISYHHRDDGWFEMELYLPLLVDCPKNKMPAILSQFVKDEKCEDKAKKLLPLPVGQQLFGLLGAAAR